MNEAILTVEERGWAINIDRIARIGKKTRERLGVSVGDPIKIRGRKNAVATVREALDEDKGKGIIGLGSYLARSADVKDGDRVKVSSIKLSKARKMVIAPVGVRVHLIVADEDIPKLVREHALENRAFYKGNWLFIKLCGCRISFEVVATVPKNRAVLVTSKTSLTVLEEPQDTKRAYPREGMTLGRKYELQSLLGAGHYGEVWRARDTTLDRIVAIKLMHAGKRGFPQLKKEGRALSALSHDNIVLVYDLGSDEKNGWLVTELIDGESLQGHLSRLVSGNEWLSVERAVDVIDKCLEALAYAHGKKLVHGDVKPGNVLIAKNGEVKLGDFGVAKIFDESQTDVTGYPSDYERNMGSSTYSAPEVLRGQPRDFQSDLFSLGILAYVLLSGRHPFMHLSGMLPISESIKSDTYAIPKLRETNPRIDAGYEKIVHRLLERDKKKRYEKAEHVLTDWRAVKIRKICPKCKTENPVSSNYCGKCSSELTPMAKQEGAVTPQRKAKSPGVCPKCGAVCQARKTWKMVGRPDKNGRRMELTVGLFDCHQCKKSFRTVLDKRLI